MQILISFTCRSCGGENEIHWDTDWSGDSIRGPGSYEESYGVVPLRCNYCPHVSGLLKPGYYYGEEHGPPHDRKYNGQ